MTANGADHYDFDPVVTDPAAKPLPAAGAGGYRGTITDITVGVKEDKDTGKKFPALNYKIKLSDAKEEENKISEGVTLSKSVVMAPDTHPSFMYKRDKKWHISLAGAASLDMSLLQGSGENGAFVKKTDFDDWKSAAKNTTFDLWVKHRDYNGETMVDIEFSEPGTTATGSEPEPPPPPPAPRGGGRNGASAAASKTAVKRR